jgi:hypothetical protein
MNILEPVHVTDLESIFNHSQGLIEQETAILFLPKTGFASFLDKFLVLSSQSNSSVVITDVFLTSTLLDGDVTISTRPYPFGVHTWFSTSHQDLKRRAEDSKKRRFFKKLKVGTSRALFLHCDPTAAFVYDAFLVAKSLTEKRQQEGQQLLVEGTITGRISITLNRGNLVIERSSDSVIVVTAFRQFYQADPRLTLNTSPWIIDGDFRVTVENKTGVATVLDAVEEKFQHANEARRILEKRTYADGHYFTRNRVMEFASSFGADLVCQNVTIQFAVDDPLIYAEKKVSFTLEEFPPLLSVPTAAGYEIRVTCFDDGVDVDNLGAITLMEVSCPGLESKTDVCVHRVWVDVMSSRPSLRKRPENLLLRTATHNPKNLGNIIFECFEDIYFVLRNGSR